MSKFPSVGVASWTTIVYVYARTIDRRWATVRTIGSFSTAFQFVVVCARWRNKLTRCRDKRKRLTRPNYDESVDQVDKRRASLQSRSSFICLGFILFFFFSFDSLIAEYQGCTKCISTSCIDFCTIFVSCFNDDRFLHRVLFITKIKLFQNVSKK